MIDRLLQQDATQAEAFGRDNARVRELFSEQRDRIVAGTDRMFAWLMGVQWVGGVAAALLVSPKTWAGSISSTHIHVWSAFICGGLLSALPIYLALRHTGKPITRYTIAVAQMLWSALLIHLTGGRIETHFHVFGSLAFLAIYRDWRVLAPATVVIAADHAVRGIFWPQSVYGVLSATPWRTVEHAAWVLFEDIVLVIGCCRSTNEMWKIASQRAALEATKADVEAQVKERTRELERVSEDLQVASRRAGMAEVATGVLHNVGNVLNSVNVAATLAADKVRGLRIESLSRVAGLLSEHTSDLEGFLAASEKGRQLPNYIGMLAENFSSEQAAIIEELQSLNTNIDHIKHIVSMQQSYAMASGLIETVSVNSLLDDALRFNAIALERHRIEVRKDYGEVEPIRTDRQRVLQILVNLIRNAKQAMKECLQKDAILTLRTSMDGDTVCMEITDCGVGIPEENLSRIFAHGFTTKKDGHGIGLHNSAIAAKELGGSLSARSSGIGRGATFILELPRVPSEVHA